MPPEKTHFGLYMPNFGVLGSAKVLGHLAELAEAHGWDGIFIWDHVAFKNEQGEAFDVVDPWVALSVMAMKTKTIRIGTAVTPLPRRRPWKLARETVSIDHLSGGRFILGVGIGLDQTEWGDLGEEPEQKDRGLMLDEGLDVLVKLWSGEHVSHEGEHYHIKHAQFKPRPVQQPRIPVWVGGFWPAKRPARRMAKWDGMLPLFQDDSIESFKECVQYVKEQRKAQNIDTPLDVAYIGITSPDSDLSAFTDAGLTWWFELIMAEPKGFQPDDPAALDAFIERIKQGPPKAQ